MHDAVVGQHDGDLQEVRPEHCRRHADRTPVGAGIGLQSLADHVTEGA
ncbi:MAG: hypothetical protein ACREQ5_21070 [Candidatus Dormibacteria bacterium]